MSAVTTYLSANEIMAAATVLPALDILIVCARFYTRSIQRAKFKIDDWLIIPALLCVIGMGVSLIIGIVNKAVGYPTPHFSNPEEALTATIPQVVMVSQIEYALQLLAIAALALVKLSVAFFCRRIFVVRKGAFSVVTWVVVGIVVVWFLVIFITTAIGCNGHVSAVWASNQVQERYCTAGQAWEEAFALSDFLTDILVLGLPLPMVWKLHTTVSRRLAIMGVFLLGLLVLATSTTRFVIYTKLVFSNFDRNKTDRDLLVSATLYWTMLEAGIAIIAACLPTLRFLFGKVNADNMIRSIRSAISLRSWRSSQHSGNSRSSRTRPPGEKTPQAPYEQMSDAQSDHSRTKSSHNVQGTSSQAGRVEGDVPELPRAPDAIYVQKEITQTEQMV